MDVGQSLRQHAETSLSDAIGKYFDRAIEAHVVFSKQNSNFHTDITAHAGRGIMVQGSAEAADAYAAFNGACEHVAKRLRRHKRRLRNFSRHASQETERFEAQQYVLRDHDDESQDPSSEPSSVEAPVVVAEMTTELPTITVSEAVMRLDLADLQAMMFRNSAHGGLNMVYRRRDGNIGWVDPQGARATAPQARAKEA